MGDPQLRLATGASMHEHLQASDLVVISFSRREVLSGHTGDAVDRLMSLSDTRENVERFAGAVLYQFEGFDDDEREVTMIPACRSFFQQVTALWNYWMHFLADEAELMMLSLALLTPIQPVATGSGRTGFTVDPDELQTQFHRLATGIRALYAGHALDAHLAEQRIARVRSCLPLP